MIQKTINIIIGLAATALCHAQELSTEVVVDRNIVPSENKAARPEGIAPAIVLPVVSPAPLYPATYTTLSEISRNYSVLSPARGGFAAEKSPYRGYVVAGYFPAVDFGVSAGYRILDSDKMSLGARFQFDSERYRPYGEKEDMGVQYFAGGTLGVDFLWRPMADSEFSTFVQYDYLRDKTTYWYPQNINSGNIGAKWHSHAGPVSYSADILLDFEKTSDTYRYLSDLDASPLIKGLSQQTVRFGATAEMPLAAGSSIGLAVDGGFVHTSNVGNPTNGIIDVTPYYSYRNKRFGAKLGVKLDFAKTSTRHKTSVMPDIRLQWIPINEVGIWADITGGSEINPFSTIRQECVYQLFQSPYERSRIPVSLEAGVNIGPFKGFYVGLFGGYAKADNWLMASNSPFASFEAVDIDGWHLGAKAGAQWRFIKAEVSVDFAPSSYAKAWYTRRDRAATVFDATLELTPLKPLSVTVDYEFRNRRKAYLGSGNSLDLGCVSNLSAGVQWRFTDRLSVFGRVENLLCRRYMMVAWEPSRKVTGLVGLSYKF